MENIEMRFTEKYWPSIQKWAVSIVLPSYEFWGDCEFDKDKDKAKSRVIASAKKHIEFVREYKAASEQYTKSLTV